MFVVGPCRMNSVPGAQSILSPFSGSLVSRQSRVYWCTGARAVHIYAPFSIFHVRASVYTHCTHVACRYCSQYVYGTWLGPSNCQVFGQEHLAAS